MDNNSIVFGEVGMKLASGDVVLTKSGNVTSPFPQINLSSSRKSLNTLKRVDAWLMLNAFHEALRDKNSLAAYDFEKNMVKPSEADKLCAEIYLFGL